MKKMLLLSLFLIAALCGENRPDERMIYIYRTVPHWEYDDSAVLPFGLLAAAWAAKDTDYLFDEFEYHDNVVYKLYNDDCSFSLIFNNQTRTCEIEFRASNDSFNYPAFKKMIDFFFL